MYSSKYAPKPADAPAASAPAAPPPEKPVAAPAPARLEPTQEPAPPVASSNEYAFATDPGADEFAQTRPPDDLFDDDFTPVAESQLVYDGPSTAAAPEPEQQPPREPRQTQSRGDLPRGVPRGPRGRGRGGRTGGGTPVTASTGAATRTATASPPDLPTPDPPAEAAPPVEVTPEEQKSDDAPSTSPPSSAPTGPAAGKSTPSVRGDRSLTGGPAKKKLTEDELNAKLAAMSLKNKALTEAHEKALADQDAFAEREKVAAARRKVERIERQAMMGEREKNRQRKLQVMGGREWDAEKNEEDFKDEGRKARRGAHGGITGSRHSTPVVGEGEAPDTIEGGQRGGHDGSRGGRGRGRGGNRGGRGRGDNHNHSNPATANKPDTPQSVPKPADFPDLPPAAPPAQNTDGAAPRNLEFPGKKKTAATEAGAAAAEAKKEDLRPKLDKQTSFGFSPATEKRSWADQMDATSPS